MNYSNKHITFLSFLALLFLQVNTFQAQNIQVLDTEDNTPVDRVLIFNKSKTYTITTDKNGKADISGFAGSDVLIFQHLSYQEHSLVKKEINENHIIYLEYNANDIEEVVLTASRSKENRSRIAEQVEIIGLNKIQELNPQTSADLLGLTPGVKVQKSQFGGGSPVLRGMEANRVLLVIDGVRMNNAIYRKGHIQNSITISPNLLARTEVLFGPSSIIYGSDALGGVIHYYTKKPKLSKDKAFNSALLSRYSSVNSELSASYTGEYSTEKWASLTAISVGKFGDLKMGKNRTHGFDNWGLVPFYSQNTTSYYTENPTENEYTSYQRNTGYSQIDLLQKVLIPLSSNTELSLNLQYSNTTDIPRFDKLNEEQGTKYAEWYYGPQKRFMSAAQLAVSPQSKYLDNGTITLAFQDIYESRNVRKYGSLTKYFGEENVKVYSLNGDFHVPLSENQKRILSYGFETVYNNVSSTAYAKELLINNNEITGFNEGNTVQTRYPDGGSNYTTFAVYTNYRFDYSKKGTINIGARHTNTLLKAKWIDNTYINLPSMNVSLNNAAFSGTIGHIYKPTDSWQISSVLSSGFRSPNIDDIGKIREKRGKVSVPNTRLQPEYAYNAEIGIAKYFNKRKTRIGFNTYYMLLQNYIARDYFALNGENEILYNEEMAHTMANVNKGNAYIQGATLSAKTAISKNLRARSSITYTKGVAYDNPEPLSSIPPVFGDLNLNYRYKKFRFGFNFRFNAKKETSLYNISEGIDNIEETPLLNADTENIADQYYGSPAWQTYGFSTQYKLNQYAIFRLHMDNILDTHYKEFASGVSAPGRNFSLSVNTHF